MKKRVCLTFTEQQYHDLTILAGYYNTTLHNTLFYIIEANRIHYEDIINKEKQRISQE